MSGDIAMQSSNLDKYRIQYIVVIIIINVIALRAMSAVS